MKTISCIEGNRQRLDGGAMFGNAPKALWARWANPDENNTIDLACRCLLVQESSGRNILLETGIGAFFDPKAKQRYGIYQDRHILIDNLAKLGLSDKDIDIVILSHLHFDHAGGLLAAWRENSSLELLFPKAKYIVSHDAWQRALNPHPRDRASFIPELLTLLEQSNRLIIVNDNHCDLLGKDYRFWYSHGHTPGMLHTIMDTAQGPIFFAADLIPGIPWVNAAITMGYDRYPELVIDEKKIFLTEVESLNGYVFYTHDPEYAMSKIQLSASGKFEAVNLRSSATTL